MKSLSSKAASTSAARGDEEGRWASASAASESRRFWKREELADDDDWRFCPSCTWKCIANVPFIWLLRPLFLLLLLPALQLLIGDRTPSLSLSLWYHKQQTNKVGNILVLLGPVHKISNLRGFSGWSVIKCGKDYALATIECRIRAVQRTLSFGRRSISPLVTMMMMMIWDVLIGLGYAHGVLRKHCPLSGSAKKNKIFLLL